MAATVEERVASFLLANAGKAFCAKCLAAELAILRDRIRAATTALATSGRFDRVYGRCAKRIHGTNRKVTRALP